MMRHMNPSSNRPASVWWRDVTDAFPPLEGRHATEIAIVGGGIAGVTLAYTLAEQGTATMLVDGSWIAGSATGRNAGFLMAGPAEPYAELVALYGRAGARAVLQIGRRNHARVKTLVESLGIECDYRSRGTVRLARTEEEAADQRASLPLLREDGFRTTEVAVADIVPAVAARAFRAAFFDPEDGELDPVRFVRELAHHAVRRGVGVHEHSAVITARNGGDGWTVRTEHGEIEARVLVLATNAFAPQLAPPLDPLIRPRRGQMLATAPIPHEVAKVPAYAHWGYHYWRQLPDGRLLVGGWRDVDLDGEVGFDDHPNARIQGAIEKGLLELVPEGAPIEHRWAGIMAFARDGRPLVGWLDPERHLAVVAGFTGHGLGMATACTEALVDLLAFRDAPAIATFAPSRFPEISRHAGPFLTVER